LVLWWFVITPMTATAAAQCWQHCRQDRPLEQRDEAACLFFLAALVSFFCVRALYDPVDPLFMDTIRLFFALLSLAAIVASPLIIVPVNVRRGVVSFLILLHFGGLVVASLSVPPNIPNLVTHLNKRIYRPYLETVYLTNAYHFYAPEPGPATYLWFRIK